MYLIIARKSLVKSKTQAINQIRALLVTAPEHIRARFYLSSLYKCIEECQPIQSPLENVIESTLVSMPKLLAASWELLSEELKLIDKQLKKLTSTTLLKQFCVGSYVAATLLVTAGDTLSD
ncbi:hypothetical protein [Pseudoalteromonas sp.]|uniref:hypothetical protein n=1 Tax=Pseudoalteromonas sp. TaxID=53249 RepID=UPI0035679981